MPGAMRWSTSLKPSELWLNSDREILARATTQANDSGNILLTVELPNEEQFQAEVDKLNAETGSTFCDMAREYFNEWKASQDAASRRSHRDRELSTILDAEGQPARGEPEAGVFPVQETVQALEETVYGPSALEEDILHRLDANARKSAELRRTIKELKEKLTLCEDLLEAQATEEKQLEQIMEVISASKVLEEVSEGVHGAAPGEEEGIRDKADSSEAESGGST